MCALGKVMRNETGAVFCTELTALFAIRASCCTHSRKRHDKAAYRPAVTTTSQAKFSGNLEKR